MASLKSLRKRYERSIENQDYYGAEQACRMMHHRLTQGKKQTNEDIEKALSILLDASVELLSRKQAQAGTALGLTAVKHYVDYKTKVTEESVAALQKIADTFDPTSGNSLEVRREKLRLLRASLAWSSREDCEGFPNGHPTLNALTARAAAEVENYELSQQLYLFSDAPEESATFLYKYASEHTNPDEYGLVLTRVIIRYLASENLKDACTVRIKFSQLAGWSSIENGGSGNHPPPLGNFCELLVKLCQLEKGAGPLYQKICMIYKNELHRDDSIAPILARIGTRYFGIQPPQPSGMAEMMSTMLRGMMGNS
ncbi:Golgi to ER traffic protein 4-like [Gracilariopsis chorda]|uniref:Golgi to ER traffic protein 4-like n=1 Tax=Gracilariopsis chorda TaxID=448386 RepID=A0A2V3IUY2_9FLOR|nr:Golgi to ER traffic protein 4-like [Gracilariopsis chorda]|eukprot:PXF45915.1 Golgi to ER traffic protein 4-like [Gracilariopsis chorda]